MKLISTLFLTFSLFFFGSNANAGIIKSKVRSYSYTCDAYTQSIGDAVLNYVLPTNDDVRSVELIFGQGGKSKQSDGSVERDLRFDWANIQTVTMNALGPHEWETKIQVILAQKNVNIFSDSVQFVVKISLSNGAVWYEKGSRSRLGFFNFSFPPNPKCVTDALEIPDYADVKIDSIIRD